MLSPQRVQQMQLSRYDHAWRQPKPYMPAAPVQPRPSRSLKDRLQRWFWRALYRRL
ncbi:hypothetical protein JST97_31885 [bacterium]|nr:hypothetical protein [bacterium]